MVNECGRSLPVARIRRIVAGLLVSVLAGSCASLSTAFSRGGGALAEARTALAAGNGTEAIGHALRAARLDPRLVQAREFVRDTWDTAIGGAKEELASGAESVDTAVVARRVALLETLARLESGLEELGLPLTHPSGTWSWQPARERFAEALGSERERAIGIHLAAGDEALDRNDVAAARRFYADAIVKFASGDPRRQSETTDSVVATVLRFARDRVDIPDTRELALAADACAAALAFRPGEAELVSLARTLATRIADLLVMEGRAAESLDEIPSLERAAALYREATSRNPAHPDAFSLLGRVVDRLAEKHYQRGRSLEERFPPANRQEILAAYRESRRWVENYRDTVRRIHTILADDTLARMRTPLSEAGSEMGRLYARIVDTSFRIDSASARTVRDAAIGDRLRSVQASLDGSLDRLSALVAGTRIAYVAQRLSASADPVATSLRAAVGELDTAGRTGYPPLHVSFAAAKGTADRTKGSVETLNGTLSAFSRSFGLIPECLSRLHSEDDFISAGKDLDDLAGSAEALRLALLTINQGFDTLLAMSADIVLAAPSLDGLEGGLFRLSPVVHALGAAVADLESAMTTTVFAEGPGKPVSATVGTILRGLSPSLVPYERALSLRADEVLEPLLARLTPEIPPVPFLEEYSAYLKRYPARSAVAATVAASLSSSLSAALTREKQVDTRLRRLSVLTNCHLTRRGRRRKGSSHPVRPEHRRFRRRGARLRIDGRTEPHV